MFGSPLGLGGRLAALASSDSITLYETSRLAKSPSSSGGSAAGFSAAAAFAFAAAAALPPAAEEAAAISALLPDKHALVALDERGKSVDSAGFAQQLGRWRDEGLAQTVFVIGGADGLSPELQRKASLRIAFGSATWPHQMVRVMLLEQIYRAATILAGHPYHRA